MFKKLKHRFILTNMAMLSVVLCPGRLFRGTDESTRWSWKFRPYANRKFFWFYRGCGSDPELYGAGVG